MTSEYMCEITEGMLNGDVSQRITWASKMG